MCNYDNISGGILKLGVSSNDKTLYFIQVNSIVCLTLFCVDVRFIGEMNSVIYVTDGTIHIEKVKINKQSWVYPLIDVNSTASGSGAAVELLSINVTYFLNSLFNLSSSSYGRGLKMMLLSFI
jgi:hypothetical protein